MNTFFSVFGKVAFVVLLAALLIGAGIVIGKKMNASQVPAVTETASSGLPTPTGTPAVVTDESSPSGTPTEAPSVKISITGVSPFASFTITAASGWTKEQTMLVDRPKLILSNEGYKLIISQGAGGAGNCAFPGDPPSDFASPMNTPVDVTGISGLYRRATTKGNKATGPQTYTVCEKKKDSWGFPTQFGYITYETPENPSDTVLLAMDVMLASMKK